MDETEVRKPAGTAVDPRRLADEGIPPETIAPQFTGRFNKGVDYVGDPACNSTASFPQTWP